MSEPAQDLRMTATEFVKWDDGSNTRYELIHGHVTAMAPPATRHARIAGNAWGEVDRRLESRPPCGGLVEAGIWLDDDNYFVADVAATCAPSLDEHFVQEPFLIVEVISPSNEKEELAIKAQAYIRLTSVQEIWFIDSRKRWVQQWRRSGPSSWIVTLPLAGSATYESPSLGGEPVALDRLYRNTGL
jgi:Uma2 family endonuclease